MKVVFGRNGYMLSAEGEDPGPLTLNLEPFPPSSL